MAAGSRSALLCHAGVADLDHAEWQPTAPAVHVNHTPARPRPYVDRARRIVRAESCSAGAVRYDDHAMIAARTIVSAITIMRNSKASACVGNRRLPTLED